MFTAAQRFFTPKDGTPRAGEAAAQFSVEGREYIWAGGVVAIVASACWVALSMGHLTSRLREREVSLGRRQREAEALLRVVQNAALSPGLDDGFDSAVSAMKVVIGADIAVVLRNDQNDLIRDLHIASRFTPSDEDWKAVCWCHEKGRAVGRYMGSFGDLQTSWLPMIAGETRIGVVGFLWQD